MATRVSEPPIRVLGFDPGSTTFGTAVMEISRRTKQPKILHTETITATKLFKPSQHKQYIICRGVRDLRISLIRSELKRIITKWNPDVIIAEAPFLKRRNVSAFEALVEVRCMIRDIVWEIRPEIRVIFVDPIRVKNYIGVSHIGTDKSHMYTAVHAFYDSRQKNNSLESADEHSIDAVAVCNVYYRRDVLGEVIESTKKKRKRGKKNVSKRSAEGDGGKQPPRRSGRKRSSGNGGDTPG